MFQTNKRREDYRIYAEKWGQNLKKSLKTTVF